MWKLKWRKLFLVSELITHSKVIFLNSIQPKGECSCSLRLLGQTGLGHIRCHTSTIQESICMRAHALLNRWWSESLEMWHVILERWQLLLFVTADYWTVRFQHYGPKQKDKLYRELYSSLGMRFELLYASFFETDWLLFSLKWVTI